MKVQSIREGCMSVGLSPEDCVLLAEACQVAAENIIAEERAQDIARVETMGAVFHAAGIAAYGQRVMALNELPALERVLQDVGLHEVPYPFREPAQ